MSDFLSDDSQDMNSSDAVPLITDAGIDDLPPDHPVHVLLGIVADLDLEEMEKKAQESLNPMLLPRMLLTLLYYGFLSGISSSEELAKAVHKSGALQCITGGLFPAPADFDRFCRLFSEEISSLFYEISLLMLLSGKCESYDCSFNRIDNHHQSQEFREKLKSQIAEWQCQTLEPKAVTVPLAGSLPDIKNDRIQTYVKKSDKIRTFFSDMWQGTSGEGVLTAMPSRQLFWRIFLILHGLIALCFFTLFVLLTIAASQNDNDTIIFFLMLCPIITPSLLYIISFKDMRFRITAVAVCVIFALICLVCGLIGGIGNGNQAVLLMGVFTSLFYAASALVLFSLLQKDLETRINKRVKEILHIGES
ncbi:hypothetical protein LJC24_04630 [Desulfococcaceae bacterium OttesenSCG-928-F15]|nr:hypothetical protein [Desulfococcaceae bacterium OttesenSCG-928-F15]